MNYRDKTKAELIKELKKLQQKYDSLKTSNEKDIAERKLTVDALQQSEKRYQNLFETASDSIFIVDQTTGYIIEANPAASKLYGYSNEEFLRLKARDVSAEPGKTEAAISASITKVPFRLHRRKDGTKFPVEIMSSYFTQGGRKLHTAFIRDITVSKQVEEELALLAHTIRSISESVSITDQENKILFVNEAFLKTYGYTLEELIGKSISIVRSTKTEPSIDDILYTTLHGGWHGELLNQKKDGTEFPISLSTSIVCNEKRQKIALVGITSDITERKQAEELLKESTERLHEAQKLAHIGVWDWKSDTDTVTWTDELYRIAGLDPMLPAPTYKEHSNLYTPESWELLKTGVEKAMETGESYQFELELIRPNGDTRYLNAFGGAKYDSKGQIIGLFGTVQDITERRRAEEALYLEKENFRNSLDDSPLGVRIVTIEGDTIYANKTLLDFYGYDSLEELQKTPLKDRYTPESYAPGSDKESNRENTVI